MTTETVLKEVLRLRKRQDKNFGPPWEQKFDREHWNERIAINNTWSVTLVPEGEYRKHLIIVAALAVSAIEAFDRKTKSQG